MKFLNFIFSVQGYGLTEVAACTTLNAVDEFVTEEVGPPNQVLNPRIWIQITQMFYIFLWFFNVYLCSFFFIQGVQIKLVNWEEGNYRVTDQPNARGEVVIGGNNVADG